MNLIRAWLRVGRRREGFVVLCALVAVIAIGVQGLQYNDASTTYVFFEMGALLAGLGVLPALILLRTRRSQEASNGLDKPTTAPASTPGRVGLYSALFVLTIVSATVQVFHGMVAVVGSVAMVYLWNLGLLGIVIVLGELASWFKSWKKRPDKF